MKQNNDELANSIWISRFWAQYNKLPESVKEGFCSLVIGISREIKEESGDYTENRREKAVREGS